MSYVAFAPAIIALVGGSTLAGVIWCFANRDMPSNRTAELYSRRKALLEKKRSASRPDTVDSTASKLRDVVQAVDEFDPMDELAVGGEGDDLSERQKRRLHYHWLVKRNQESKERIRKFKYSRDPINPEFLHYVLSHAGEPEVNLGPLPVIETSDVQFGDIDTNAEGVLKQSMSILASSRSALTGEFVSVEKIRKAPRRRVTRGKPA